jgi:hypothetical protein
LETRLERLGKAKLKNLETDLRAAVVGRRAQVRDIGDF